MITIEKVSKNYKSNQVKVLEDINIKISKGEIVGLLGSNGAGKTTLIKILCGLINADEGTVSINNEKWSKKSVKYISTVLEGNRNLYWRLTLIENIEYFLGIKGYSIKAKQKKINLILEKFNLSNKKHEIVGNLSRGMQQKIAIIIAILSDTEILILDEPTLGLDVKSNKEMVAFLKEIVKDENKTILISSHDMALIEQLCSRVIIISNGKIITDNTIDELNKLFKTKSVVITLTEKLDAEKMESMFEYFGLLDMYEEEGKTNIIFNINDSINIYSIFEFFKNKELIIEKFDKRDINFEQVFLKIIGEETT